MRSKPYLMSCIALVLSGSALLPTFGSYELCEKVLGELKGLQTQEALRRIESYDGQFTVVEIDILIQLALGDRGLAPEYVKQWASKVSTKQGETLEELDAKFEGIYRGLMSSPKGDGLAQRLFLHDFQPMIAQLSQEAEVDNYVHDDLMDLLIPQRSKLWELARNRDLDLEIRKNASFIEFMTEVKTLGKFNFSKEIDALDPNHLAESLEALNQKFRTALDKGDLNSAREHARIFCGLLVSKHQLWTRANQPLDSAINQALIKNILDMGEMLRLSAQKTGDHELHLIFKGAIGQLKVHLRAMQQGGIKGFEQCIQTSAQIQKLTQSVLFPFLQSNIVMTPYATYFSKADPALRTILNSLRQTNEEDGGNSPSSQEAAEMLLLILTEQTERTKN